MSYLKRTCRRCVQEILLDEATLKLEHVLIVFTDVRGDDVIIIFELARKENAHYVIH